MTNTTPTPGCKRWGHHFNPATQHCNRCLTPSPAVYADADRVLTKHGYKARAVLPAQEAAMDTIAKDRVSDPIVKVNVLNESFHGLVQVITTDGENRTTTHLIAADGTTVDI